MLTNHASSPSDGNVPLTPCELQVCYELIRTPLSLKEIATKLGKALKTVDVQATSAYRKLNVTSRLELIQRFGSGTEVKVSHVSSRDVAHGIMERLDEINSKLNYLLAQTSYFRDTAA
jgi:DNA-binding CsgD family transcriptional regulator